MPSLRELQTGFALALFDASASRQAPGIRSNGLSPAARLGFYRTNVFENYRKALAATYPALQAVVGKGCFSQLAQEYTRRHRSRSSDVGLHGERFADFLERHPIATTLPYLSDLARLEWAIEESFYEADPVSFPLDALAQVPEAHYAELRFDLAPSTRLLESVFPVHQIWQMSQSAEGNDDATVDAGNGGVQLLVRRERFEVRLESLQPADFAMLRALQSGYGFGEAFAYAQSLELAFDPCSFLQRYVSTGVLCGFTLPSEVCAP
jgi:hypothetical protein